jgi:tetratricopeptide (TPR) repeat protein
MKRMARQPQHLAEQQRTLGRYLAALREAAGLYQVDIARAVPCHRTTVTHAEAGSQLPDGHFWEIADRIVDANGALIASYDELIQAKAAHLAEQQAKRRARAQATAQQLRPAPSPGFRQALDGLRGVHADDRMDEQPGAHAPQEVSFDPMKRRTLLQWGPGVTTGSTPSALGGTRSGQPDIADEQQFAPRTVPEAALGLDVDLVEHFQQMKNVLMDNDNIFGANSAILSVREQIGALRQLQQSYRGASRQKLLHIQTQFADLCGWLYQDSGDYRASTYWSGRALEWSHMCDDHNSIAFILARRSQLAGDMEDPAEAIDAAEAALKIAPQKVGRTAAVAMTYAAHGHALRQDIKNCERSYTMAQDLVGQLKEDPVSPWALFLDHSYIEVQRARSLTFLGEYGAAVESFQKTISCLPHGYRRDCGVYLAREAVAHIGNGDVEQASSVGLRALAIGAETGSARIIGELKCLDTALGRFSTTSNAANFHNALHETYAQWILNAVQRERELNDSADSRRL